MSLSPPNASIDLTACREAFIAVLASVCDPHLNTIHAVCQKFSESRAGLPSSSHSLNPPRPVNRPLDRPLDIFAQFAPSVLHGGPSLAHSFSPIHTSDSPTYPSEPTQAFDSSWFANLFPTIPATEYIPTLDHAGPLSLPFLEPQHPIFGLELDCDDIWACVLTIVDMSRTDAEALASRLTEKVRCYGFGPVMTKQDVLVVCEGLSYLKVRLSQSLKRCLPEFPLLDPSALWPMG